MDVEVAHEPKKPQNQITKKKIEIFKEIKLNLYEKKKLKRIGEIIEVNQRCMMLKSSYHEVLKLDSPIFCLIQNNWVHLGKIDDILGSVDEPLYCIFYNEFTKQNFKSLEQIQIYIIFDQNVFFGQNELREMKLNIEKQNEVDYQDFNEDEHDRINSDIRNIDFLLKRNQPHNNNPLTQNNSHPSNIPTFKTKPMRYHTSFNGIQKFKEPYKTKPKLVQDPRFPNPVQNNLLSQLRGNNIKYKNN